MLPVFLDEALHIQWSERLFAEGRITRPIGAGRLLAVLTYGLALPFEDRVWAARAIAALIGALTLLLTLRLAFRLFGSTAAVAAGVLYVSSPLALTYDRLALSDGFLAATIAALLVLTLDVAGSDERRSITLAGFTITAAVLTKVSALLFVPALPLGAALFARSWRHGLARAALALLSGLVLASPMLAIFALRGGEIATQHVVDPAEAGVQMRETLASMLDWARAYISIPAIVAALGALLLLRDRVALWLFIASGLPVLLLAVIAQPWSARYILPCLPPLLVLLAGGVSRIAARMSHPAAVAVALAITLSVPHAAFVRALLIEPHRAPFPEDDRRQLVTGWPSGYGIRELAARLVREAKRSAITVYLDSGGTRTVATDLAVLLGRRADIRLVEADLGSNDVRSRMVLQEGRLLAVMGPRADDIDLRAAFERAVVERLEVFTRPEGEWTATLFEIRFP